jgi:hypothetical protein
MERIQAAIQKAKEQRADAPVPTAQPAGPLAAARQARSGYTAPPAPAWAELAPFEPDAQLMARHRIVTFADADPAHTTFDMIRTKILRVLRQNGWTSLGITSPTSGCGGRGAGHRDGGSGGGESRGGDGEARRYDRSRAAAGDCRNQARAERERTE